MVAIQHLVLAIFASSSMVEGMWLLSKRSLNLDDARQEDTGLVLTGRDINTGSGLELTGKRDLEVRGSNNIFARDDLAAGQAEVSAAFAKCKEAISKATKKPKINKHKDEANVSEVTEFPEPCKTDAEAYQKKHGGVAVQQVTADIIIINLSPENLALIFNSGGKA